MEKYLSRSEEVEAPKIDTESLIGKDFSEIQGLVFGGVRAVVIDGVSQCITMNLRRDRLNVEISNGKVVAIKGWY